MSPTKKKIVITNKVQDFCNNHGITYNEYVAKCIAAPLSTETGRSLTVDTVTRVYNGETNVTLPTAALIAGALGVDIGDLFELDN